MASAEVWKDDQIWDIFLRKKKAMAGLDMMHVRTSNIKDGISVSGVGNHTRWGVAEMGRTMKDLGWEGGKPHAQLWT